MTKLLFIIHYNKLLLEQGLLHRDIVVLCCLANLSANNKREATACEIAHESGEPNAANVLRRLASSNLIAARNDTRRVGKTTIRAVYYSINQKGIEALSKIITQS
jgi:hypothetical protein